MERKFFLCYRSSCPEVFCKKGVLKNFAKFTGKHFWLLVYQSLRFYLLQLESRVKKIKLKKVVKVDDKRTLNFKGVG